MEDLARLFPQFENALEDFWNRRLAEPSQRREFRVFGHLVQLASNEARVLEAAGYTRPMYSTMPDNEQPPFAIQVVVQPARVSPGAVPDSLMDLTWYSGHGQWLMIQLGKWGSCYVDLQSRQAAAVICPELAGRPDLVSRCLLNTVLLNLCIERGFGMLHASCLVKEGRALLLLAPHNTGKSTTALRLALAGYRLLSDSMVFVSPFLTELHLAGFPVGMVKLREDMLGHFPQLDTLLTAEEVRDETKYRVDLRRLDESLVQQSAMVPTRVELCLMARSEDESTQLNPADEQAVWQAVLQNSLYFDRPEIWRQNLAQLRRCVQAARWHHLAIGADPAELVAVLDQLWEV